MNEFQPFTRMYLFTFGLIEECCHLAAGLESLADRKNGEKEQKLEKKQKQLTNKT
jgi:hypothetical protein